MRNIAMCLAVVGIWASVFSLAVTSLSRQSYGQVVLQYIVPQDGSPAPDPSLIDARPDNGTGNTDQGWQTFGDFNTGFIDGWLYSSTVDGRTVLRRKSTGSVDDRSEAGLRTNGSMLTSSGGPAHGGNANTFNAATLNSMTAVGFRTSVKVWLPDQPNLAAPIEFPLTGAATTHGPRNAASVLSSRQGALAGFGVRTNADGEMVLFPFMLWSTYNANPSLYEYVIPDLTANDGTQNNLHIIDMLVKPGVAQADFYVDGVAVPNLQNFALTVPPQAAGTVQWGDCCAVHTDVEWAIEWLKVEGGVTTPHAVVPEPSVLVTLSVIVGVSIIARRRCLPRV